MLDWLRIWPELFRLNLQKARYRRRLGRAGSPATRSLSPAPCQCPSDSGRALATRCEACLRFDSATRYRFVCPDASVTSEGVVCTLDAADVRPRWRGVTIVFLATPSIALVLGVLGFWLSLRLGAGLDRLPLADVAWPPRWANIDEYRRDHFRDLAAKSLASGDVPAATIALFAAARTGVGEPSENISLARLATLSGLHGLADEIYLANFAANPELNQKLALAWHDDLLIANRPVQLARLSIEQLNREDTDREFWLYAFFTSIRHPGVAASVLALDPPPKLPHPGLRPALETRAALDRGDSASATDGLLTLRGSLPGSSARRFLVHSWLDARAPGRARAAAMDTKYPVTEGEIALLSYSLLHDDEELDAARTVLRPLIAKPEHHPAVLAALFRQPDAALLQEISTRLTPADRARPALLSALWLAARRTALADLALETETQLLALGLALPAPLGTADFATPADEALSLAATLLPLDREMLYALRAP